MKTLLIVAACVTASTAVAQYTVDFLPTPNGDELVTGAGGGQIVGGRVDGVSVPQSFG